MTSFYFNRFSYILIFTFLGHWSIAQNLAPNPDFEIYSTCPTWLSGGGPLECEPWGPGNGGSPDYFHVCSTAWVCDVPTNVHGYQQPHSGEGYTGFAAKDALFEYREYLMAPLTQPLTAGMAYWVTMYVNLGDPYCGIQTIGALFTNDPPNYQFNDDGPLDYSPQIESNIGFISETVNWVLISGCFLAEGGEDYITIGNYHNDLNTPIDPNCIGGQGPYYYLEDVSVESMPAQFFDLDLGDPVVECFSYEIDPGLSTSFHYTWEDGSHAPTLYVTESGTYAVTIADDCVFGIDSIEVTILGTSIVELGPAEIDLCEGETYEISLDPTLGNYLWQDGSTNSNYTITTSGLYQVTLDDGCTQSMDEIQVNGFGLPSSSLLGPDVSICPGDVIDFSFDPDQGEYIWQDGSTNPGYTITEPGNYALTISNICGEYSDDIEITLIEPLDFNLGNDQVYLCEGTFYDLELDPNLGDFLWQDGSILNTYSVSAPGIYALTVTNACESISDSFEAIYLQQPVFDLGEDLVLCSNQLPILLDLSGLFHVNYQWENGSSDSQHEIFFPGAYGVTVSNECYEEYDEVEVAVLDSNASVILPADQLLCQGQSFVITNSGDTGNYLWQDNSTADTLLANTPGTYSLTVSTICGIGIDTVIVDYLPLVSIPDLGADISLCPGEQFILAPSNTGVSFLWQDMSTADSLLVTGPGTYYVQVSDQCTSASDTIQITLNNNPPQLSLPTQLSLCQGQSFTLDAMIGGVSYLWNDNSQTSSITVSAPGTYSLTVSNACGADMDTVLVLDGGPPPIVVLGSDVTLCAGDVLTLSPAYYDVTSWLWNDGSTDSMYTISGNEWVAIQVSNACGIAYDTLQATLLPATPSIDLGADTSFCPEHSLLLTINTPNVDIEWSDGSFGNQFLVQNPGTYSATISNSCGENSDSIIIEILPPAPVLNLGGDQSLCPGEVITLDPGLNNVNYLWQDGSTTTSFNATQAGIIILTVTNTCGFDSDTLEISESSEGPDVHLGPDVLACEGENITLSSDISGVEYLWQDGSTAAELTTSSSGAFILQVSNNCGTDADTVMVEINGTAPIADLGQDTTLCTGGILVLLASMDPGTDHLWQDGSSSSSIVVNAAGTYSLLETNHCGVSADTIQVEYLSPPLSFTLGADTILCPDEFLTLTAPLTTDIITWQDGSHVITIIADQAKLYSLELSNECGMTKDEMTLSFDTDIPHIDLDLVAILCPGEVVELDVTQAFPAIYSWNTGSNEPILITDIPGNYSVIVQTLCTDAQGSVEVVVSDTCFAENSFFLPNVFSPNDDGINDVFTIGMSDGIEVHSLQAEIFDRWGNMVFQSNTIPFQWDGDFNGTPINPGVYIYRIEVSYFDQAVERKGILHGDITLIR